METHKEKLERFKKENEERAKETIFYQPPPLVLDNSEKAWNSINHTQPCDTGGQKISWVGTSPPKQKKIKQFWENYK